MGMKVYKVRLGHATNSSSTHFIIRAGTGTGERYTGMEFGWDNFLLDSRDSKLRYFAAMLKSSMGESYATVAGELFGLDPAETTEMEDAYVDHQSVLAIPKFMDGRDALPFFRDMAYWIADDPSVQIEGGNDNGGAPGGTPDEKWSRTQSAMKSYNRLLVRRETGENWLLFNRATGAKVLIGPSGEVAADGLPRSVAPELIDVKITDHCTIGCSYCYQGSVPGAPHATLVKLRQIASDMKHSEVFEVALGGGEPTQHPEFLEVIKAFHDQGINVGFTTKNRAWLSKPAFVKGVLEHANSIGVSVETAQQAIDWIKRLKAKAFGTYGNPGFQLQVILGIVHLDDIEAICREAAAHYVPVLLLGHKRTGRGGTPREEAGGFMERLRDIPRLTLAVDTAAVQQYPNQLQGIDRRMYDHREGWQSMYIDAVAGTYAPCSYVGREQFKDFVGLDLAWNELGDRPEVISA